MCPHPGLNKPVYLPSASENLPEFLLGECPFPQTTAAQHVEKGKVVVNPPICSSRPRRTRIYRLKRSSRGIATVTRPNRNFARHGKIISPPSRTALYCTISAILKSKVACISAFYPNTNAVGYTTKTLEANSWYLIGSGFEGTDGNAFSIQDFITGLTAGTSAANAPTIQYWDGTKLVTLSYIEGALDTTTWDSVTAWADSGAMASTLTVAPGWGCWIKVPTAATITLSGQITATGKTLTLTEAWQLAGNPYPVATPFNGSVMDCSALTAGTSAANAPTIQYWDGTKLTTLSYIEGALDTTTWDSVTAWADSGAMASTLSLDPCTGFWIKSSTGGTITWNR